MSTKLRLTIEVEYDLNGESVQTLKSYLFDLADRAAGEGMLTGCTDAEIVAWSANVDEVNDHVDG